MSTFFTFTSSTLGIITENFSFIFSFGFIHIPTQPGYHLLEINTWKIAPYTFLDKLRERFWSGGYTLSRSDLIYSGTER